MSSSPSPSASPVNGSARLTSQEYSGATHRAVVDDRNPVPSALLTNVYRAVWTFPKPYRMARSGRPSPVTSPVTNLLLAQSQPRPGSSYQVALVGNADPLDGCR